jgi:hypothetical protein
VWHPGHDNRSTGFPSAYLDVYRGELRAYPNAVARTFGRWTISYAWPTVVVEYLRPLGHTGVLVDVDGCSDVSPSWAGGEEMCEYWRPPSAAPASM